MRKMLAVLLALVMALATTGAWAAEMSQNHVEQVQGMLNKAGYDCGTPDGVAGKKTAAAISAYQEDHGMEVTGEVSYELLLSLVLETGQMGEAAQTKEELYDATAFEHNLLLSMVDRFKAAAGEGRQEEAARELMDEYFMFPFASDDGWEIFFGNDARLVFRNPEEGVDGALPRGAFCLVILTDDKELERASYETLAAFLELTGKMYGASDEDIAGAMAVLGEAPAWGDTVSFADWESTVVAPFGSVLASFRVGEFLQICVSPEENTRDWEGMSWDIKFHPEEDEGESEDSGYAGETLYGDDVPDLPEEVVEITGGLPDNLSGIPEKYNLDKITAIAEETKLMEALRALLDGGSSFRFPLPEEDDEWTMEDSIHCFYRLADDETGNIEFDFTTEDGWGIATLKESLPEDIVFSHLSIYYPDENTISATIGRDDDGEWYDDLVFVNDYFDIGSDEWGYRRTRWIEDIEEEEVIIESYPPDGEGTYLCWRAYYSLETGELIEKLYEEYEW